MAGNRVVAHFRDGRIVKGSTTDFLPTRETLHIHTGAAVETVRIAELKALFFVRDLVGDPGRQDHNEFDVNRSLHGRRIRVEFDDGEVLVGTTQGYQPERAGFFVSPADYESNHERVFVLQAATRAVELL
jgi:hypothetical protein